MQPNGRPWKVHVEPGHDDPLAAVGQLYANFQDAFVEKLGFVNPDHVAVAGPQEDFVGGVNGRGTNGVGVVRNHVGFVVAGVEGRLKISSFCRAIWARFSRRISSSVLPENMQPLITSIQPVRVFLPKSGSINMLQFFLLAVLLVRQLRFGGHFHRYVARGPALAGEPFVLAEPPGGEELDLGGGAGRQVLRAAQYPHLAGRAAALAPAGVHPVNARLVDVPQQYLLSPRYRYVPLPQVTNGQCHKNAYIYKGR
jgi:hypothetical protein